MKYCKEHWTSGYLQWNYGWGFNDNMFKVENVLEWFGVPQINNMVNALLANYSKYIVNKIVIVFDQFSWSNWYAQEHMDLGSASVKQKYDLYKKSGGLRTDTRVYKTGGLFAGHPRSENAVMPNDFIRDVGDPGEKTYWRLGAHHNDFKETSVPLNPNNSEHIAAYDITGNKFKSFTLYPACKKSISVDEKVFVKPLKDQLAQMACKEGSGNWCYFVGPGNVPSVPHVDDKDHMYIMSAEMRMRMYTYYTFSGRSAENKW